MTQRIYRMRCSHRVLVHFKTEERLVPLQDLRAESTRPDRARLGVSAQPRDLRIPQAVPVPRNILI